MKEGFKERCEKLKDKRKNDRIYELVFATK